MFVLVLEIKTAELLPLDHRESCIQRVQFDDLDVLPVGILAGGA